MSLICRDMFAVQTCQEFFPKTNGLHSIVVSVRSNTSPMNPLHPGPPFVLSHYSEVPDPEHYNRCEEVSAL